jgi:hypothetical protein
MPRKSRLWLLAVVMCTVGFIPTICSTQTNVSKEIVNQGRIDYNGALSMLYVNGTTITNSGGPIFLLGCNVRGIAYNPAVDGRYDDWYTYRYQDARNIRAFKFNTIRLLVYWECLEISTGPDKFSFNNTYIDLIRQTVEAYNKEGTYVILNLHEHASADVLNRFLPTLGSDTDFADAFYSDTSNTSAREHIKSLWLKMSETFKNCTGVAGYDILNEPHHSSGSLSDKQVSDLWFDISDYVISALRAEGDNHIVFIEFCPAARRTDYMSRKLNDSNVVYEPHFYYGINTSDLSVLNNDYYWLKEQFDAKVNAKMLDFGVPFIMGEQGFGDIQINVNDSRDIWLKNVLTIQKTSPLMKGWLYWCYATYDGTPQPKGWEATLDEYFPIT